MEHFEFHVSMLEEIEKEMEDVRRSRCWSHEKRCHRLSFPAAKQRQVVDVIGDIKGKLQQEEFVVEFLVEDRVELIVEVRIMKNTNEVIVDIPQERICERTWKKMEHHGRHP